MNVMEEKVIYIVRHGVTASNKKGATWDGAKKRGLSRPASWARD